MRASPGEVKLVGWFWLLVWEDVYARVPGAWFPAEKARCRDECKPWLDSIWEDYAGKSPNSVWPWLWFEISECEADCREDLETVVRETVREALGGHEDIVSASWQFLCETFNSPEEGEQVRYMLERRANEITKRVISMLWMSYMEQHTRLSHSNHATLRVDESLFQRQLIGDVLAVSGLSGQDVESIVGRLPKGQPITHREISSALGNWCDENLSVLKQPGAFKRQIQFYNSCSTANSFCGVGVVAHSGAVPTGMMEALRGVRKSGVMANPAVVDFLPSAAREFYQLVSERGIVRALTIEPASLTRLGNVSELPVVNALGSAALPSLWDCLAAAPHDNIHAARFRGASKLRDRDWIQDRYGALAFAPIDWDPGEGWIALDDPPRRGIISNMWLRDEIRRALERRAFSESPPWLG